jgi:hypothetical protein
MCSQISIIDLLGSREHLNARRRAEFPGAILRCTACGTVGYVDTRLDWSEGIDFNNGIG